MKFPFQRFEVKGGSMSPTLQEGDRVVVFKSKNIRPGDVVVLYKNGMHMVKRLVSKSESGRWLVRGDSYHESTDSLDFGDVRIEDLVGKVIAHY